MNMGSLQKIVWDNKILKGYNTTDVALEFGMLHEKSSAAFIAWRRKNDILGEELADVVLYAASIAEMVGLDLLHEVNAKVEKNAARTD